jgi:Fe-S cluster assembly ATPase SufC
MAEPILRIDDVWLRRNGHEILHGANLEVYPGQVHVKFTSEQFPELRFETRG